jgi:hypothetical protein
VRAKTSSSTAARVDWAGRLPITSVRSPAQQQECSAFHPHASFHPLTPLHRFAHPRPCGSSSDAARGNSEPAHVSSTDAA